MLFNEKELGYMIELIWRIHFLSKKAFELELKKLDLTFPQFGALKVLSYKENISQRELAEIMETDTTNVMVVCDSLEKKGLIKRKTNPGDRRVNLVVCTDEGKARFKKVMPLLDEWAKRFVSLLDKREISSIVPILERMYNSIKKEIADGTYDRN
ncbi:MAG: MarR family transcriptional regulator [Spirochaetota bacterium]|nr:MAG: MarR family transcriptional regulator [Spirochaetota bacterium]